MKWAKFLSMDLYVLTTCSFNCNMRQSCCFSCLLADPMLEQMPSLSDTISQTGTLGGPKHEEPLLTSIFSPASAEVIHAWIARHLPDGPVPRLSRPFNYVKFVSITTAVLGLITFGAVAAPYLIPILQNRNLWAGISLIAVLLFTSGHMFNHIRKVPYVSGDGKGGISYFAGGFQNQFGLETQIVAAMCKSLLPPLVT